MSERPRFLFEPGRVRVGARGVGGITRGGGLGRGGGVGGGRAGGARGHGQGGGLTNFGQLVSALGAVAAARGSVVPSPSHVPYTLISTTNATGSAATIDVTGISGAFTDLIVAFKLRDASGGGANVALTFNGDTGSNYWWDNAAFGSTTSIGQIGVGATTSIRLVQSAPSTVTAGAHVYGELVIFDYAQTGVMRTCKVEGGGLYGTASAFHNEVFGTGTWTNTANAITQLTLTGVANFAASSYVRIYGR